MKSNSISLFLDKAKRPEWRTQAEVTAGKGRTECASFTKGYFGSAATLEKSGLL